MKTFVKVLALSLVAVMMCAVLVSCGGPNKDPKKAAEALEEAGYTVTTLDKGLPEGYEATVTGVKLDLENETADFIVITYYSDKEVLNAEWDEAQETLEEGKEAMAALYGVEKDDIVVKKSGMMIYVGTKAAVKAAK